MNRLQLCQTVQGLLRAATQQLNTSPTTTLNQTGIDGEIVRWVDNAYRDIQNEQEQWRFRTKRGSFETGAGQRVYPITVTHATAAVDGAFEKLLPSEAGSCVPYILNYKLADGEENQIRQWYVPWQEWTQGVFDMGLRPEGRPVRWTIQPDGQMALDPIPDAKYVIQFDYRRVLHEMTSDADAITGTPIIPVRHEMAIVWKACIYYCITRGSTQEFRANIEREYMRAMNQLRFDQLPQMLFLDSFV